MSEPAAAFIVCSRAHECHPLQAPFPHDRVRSIGSSVRLCEHSRCVNSGTVVDAGSNASPRVNLSGFIIHGAIHSARADLTCLWHSHYTPATTMASMKVGMLPLSQEACLILPRVSPTPHPFEGVATDVEEQARLVASLGSADVLLMANHGVLCGGSSVAAAFYNSHLVSRAADHQVEMMRAVGGRLDELIVPSEQMVQATADRLAVQAAAAGGQQWGRWEWDAAIRHIRESGIDDSSGMLLAVHGHGTAPSSKPSAAAAAGGTVRVDQSRLMKLRLLALHGFPGTFLAAKGVDPLAALRAGLLARGIDAQIDAPRAPTATDSEGGVAWIAGDQSAAGRLVGFGLRSWEMLEDQSQLTPESLRPFTHADLPPVALGEEVWHGAEGFAASLEMLDLLWRQEPYDAILGFSQGALMASLLAAHLVEKRGEVQPPRGLVLCGGFRLPYPAEAKSLWPPSTPLRVPSLHIIGVQDTVVAPCRSEELMSEFDRPEVWRHELIGEPRAYGGHVVPWDSAFHDRLARFLRDKLWEGNPRDS